MKVLSIGNSFSQDAQAYLRPLAEGEGETLTCVNLMIGGCSLETHWENAEGDLARYHYERDGASLYLDAEKQKPKLVTLREALTETDWDVVTMQQASHFSGLYDTYQPYLKNLSEYARKYAPGARQLIQETWAYETDSAHPAFERYGHSQARMYEMLHDAYQNAASSIGAALIPSGDVIQALRREPAFDYARGGRSLCRDGFHMGIPYGRYAVAATWFSVLFARAPEAGGFASEDCGREAETLLPLIRDVVKRQTRGLA